MPAAPSQTAHAITADVVGWYMHNYFRHQSEPGTLRLLGDRRLVGAFAIRVNKVLENDSREIFKLLIASALFQRRRDWVVHAFMRRLPGEVVREVSSQKRLMDLCELPPCGHTRRNEDLVRRCDVTYQSPSKSITCSYLLSDDCHIKRHARLLRRYADFGKLPSSAALMLAQGRIGGFSELHSQILASALNEQARALKLEASVCQVFRVSKKIAAMFLSWLSNPDLTPGAPWAKGIDWTRYVVVDSNVDAFLTSVGYSGTHTYEARCDFIKALARRVDFASFDRGLNSYNPRLVQQAMYIFMSRSNRQFLGERCSAPHHGRCWKCPSRLAKFCPLAEEASSRAV